MKKKKKKKKREREREREGENVWNLINSEMFYWDVKHENLLHHFYFLTKLHCNNRPCVSWSYIKARLFCYKNVFVAKWASLAGDHHEKGKELFF
jgi:hypothetical protein